MSSTAQESDESRENVDDRLKKVDMEPETGRCHFYVARKFRYCKMTVRSGEKYCGEHQEPESMDECNLGRVPCPLDSKHTCYMHLLKKHLKKCNARKDTVPDYIMKDVNRGKSVECGSKETITLSRVPNEALSRLIEKINNVDVPEVSSEICYHPVVENELSNDKYGASTRKHLLQNSSILGHLQNLNVLKPNSCHIEFGAGRGQLSYWIGQAMIKQGMPCLLVPIDRSSNRHKYDGKFRDEELVTVLRLRTDIADLCLWKIAPVKNSETTVALCKHLCGDATDLALRCLVNSGLNNISAIIMTPCCHHRLKWENYVDHDYLQEKGINKEEFELMTNLASWATCGQSNFDRGARPIERGGGRDGGGGGGGGGGAREPPGGALPARGRRVPAGGPLPRRPPQREAWPVPGAAAPRRRVLPRAVCAGAALQRARRRVSAAPQVRSRARRLVRRGLRLRRGVLRARGLAAGPRRAPANTPNKMDSNARYKMLFKKWFRYNMEIRIAYLYCRYLYLR